MTARAARTPGAALLAALLLPTGASAQPATARLCIEGAAAGRARLEGAATSAAIDLAGGRACFLDVDPGQVRLVVEAVGGDAALPLSIVPGERLEVRAGDSGGALELSGRFRPTLGTGFGARHLRELPSGREAWSLIETAESVAISDRIDGGGMWTAVPGRFSTHGSSWTQTSFAAGILDATDPLLTGTPLRWPDLDGIDGLDVATAALDVEVGAPGALVSLLRTPVPERFTARLEAGTTLGEGRARGPELSTPTEGPEPPVARLGRARRASAEAGGSLGRNLRLAVFGALEDGERIERGRPDRLRGERASLGARLLWMPREGQRVEVEGAGHALERPFAGRFRWADGAGSESERLLEAQATWQARASSGRVWTAAIGHRSASAESESGDGAGTFERLLQGPLPQMPLAGTVGRRRTDVAVAVQLAPRRGPGGWHALRAGVQADATGAGFAPATASALTGELLDGRPARAWLTTAPGASDWSGTDLALYAADTIAAGAGLELEGGLRVETSGASAAGGGSVRWTSLAPRLRARWTPFAPVALFGAYGRYRHRLPLGLMAWGDASAPRSEAALWSDANGDGRLQAGERGLLVSRAGPGAPVGRLDQGLSAPRTDEVVAGIEGRFGRWRVAFAGIYRWERGLVESVNVGVPESAYTVRFIPDPAGDIAGAADDQLLPLYARDPATFGLDSFLLTNPDGHDATHGGVELTVEHVGERVQVLLGATAHRSDGAGAWRGFRPAENDQGLIGDLFDDPNASTHAQGRLFSDRAYTIKLSGSWQAPAGFRLGSVARYQDGQPFARLVLAELPQGLVPVQAIPNGRARFTFALTLDARLEKDVRFAGGRRATVVAEGFNLLQRGHEVEEDAVSGPGYRTVTFRQPPRAFRLGLRLTL